MLSNSNNLTYREKLAQLFTELGEFWPSQAVTKSPPSNEKTREQLYMSSDSKNALCLFLVPENLISYYREEIYPIVQSYGFVPIRADEIYAPGDNYLAVETGLIDKAEIILIDYSSEYFNRRFISFQIDKNTTIIPIIEEKQLLPTILPQLQFITRPKDILSNNEKFIEQLNKVFSTLSKTFYQEMSNEPKRLLEYGEHKMAFISAIILLEVTLRKYLTALESNYDVKRTSLGRMVNLMIKQLEIPTLEQKRIFRWIETRNQILHYNEEFTSRKVIKYTREILDFIDRLDVPSIF